MTRIAREPRLIPFGEVPSSRPLSECSTGRIRLDAGTKLALTIYADASADIVTATAVLCWSQQARALTTCNALLSQRGLVNSRAREPISVSRCFLIWQSHTVSSLLMLAFFVIQYTNTSNILTSSQHHPHKQELHL